MASTYSNLGIELIGSGEQAGSWDVTTNRNLGSIMDNAITGVNDIVLAAAGSSGSPNALAITDGAVSDGQYRLIVYSSAADLGATAFVQITPNYFRGYYIVRNSLLGSRDLTIFQGTYDAGRALTIANAYDAIIKCDGTGLISTVSLAVNNLQVNSISGAAPFLQITNDTTTNSTMYPVWVNASSGYPTAKVSSTKFTANPSTGAQSATSFNADNFKLNSVALGTAAAGNFEYDGQAMYGVAGNNRRGLVPTESMIVLAADYTLTNSTAAQKLFNSSTNGQLNNINAGLYFFECVIRLDSLPASTTSHYLSFDFGGTAVFTYNNWVSTAAFISSASSSGNTATISSNNQSFICVTASTVFTLAFAKIHGAFYVTTGGATLIPRITMGAVSSSAVVKAGSYFKISSAGLNTTVGNWT